MIINYQKLIDLSLTGDHFSKELSRIILTSKDIQLLPLLNAAYEVRKKYCGHDVTIHIINNAQNGFCPEDCHYCAQAKSSKANIEEYPLKSEDEFLKEAKNAYEKGAYRYCMVFAGRGPSTSRVEKLASITRKIKSQYPIEICVSTGLLDDAKAKILKEAGVDRLNHNLNTSEKNYPNICSTHTYQDRLNTLQSARKAGIQLCSGIIIGLGESADDIIDVAYTLRDIKAESIPVNFLIPIEGNKLDKTPDLTPEYCLRVLCLFRFLNPKAEVRIAAGREIHLRSMQVMALYPANSLFLEGYLNTLGSESLKTLEMIYDAGFTIKSEHPLEEVMSKFKNTPHKRSYEPSTANFIKGLKELRPEMSCSSSIKPEK